VAKPIPERKRLEALTAYAMIQSLSLRRVDTDIRSMFSALLATQMDYTRCPASWMLEE
jgi:hypothetical protein